MSITYGNGQFVAVGGAPSILTSPDGLNWTSRDAGTNWGLNAVAYGNSTFVAVGTWGAMYFFSSRVLTSTDGRIWGARNPMPLAPLDVTFGLGLFVAVGFHYVSHHDPDLMAIAVSSDVLEWRSVAPTWTGDLTSVAFGNGLFVAAGSDSSNTKSVLLTSPDGTNWTSTFSFTGELTRIRFGGGLFIVLGQEQQQSGYVTQILTSADGTNWMAHYPGTVSGLLDVTFGDGTFLAVGGGGIILQSDPLSNSAPAIALQPESQRVLAGTDVALTVVALGTSPFTYRWQKGITEVPDGTNEVLLLPHAQLADSGSYSVRVTGPYGTATSGTALLTVAPVQLDLRVASQVELSLRGLPGFYEIQAADNPGTPEPWKTLVRTQLVNSPFTWVDYDSTNYLRRFYRATLVP